MRAVEVFCDKNGVPINKNDIVQGFYHTEEIGRISDIDLISGVLTVKILYPFHSAETFRYWEGMDVKIINEIKSSSPELFL